MIKIAVCDDRRADLRRLAEAVDAYVRLHPEQEFAVEAFQSPGALLSRLERGQAFHIYLLDVLMPLLSGIELGRDIRARDQACSIIYSTVSADYALDSYGVRAQNYLVKPYAPEDLYRSLDRALAELRRQRADGILLRTGGGQAFLPFHQIAYVELARRRMVFHRTDRATLQSAVLRGSFEGAAAGLLAEPRFLQPHKSFVVNMDHVTLQSGFRLLLSDGAVVPISMRKRAGTMDRLFAYFAGRGGRPSPGCLSAPPP